jgi:hypothetical protein
VGSAANATYSPGSHRRQPQSSARGDALTAATRHQLRCDGQWQNPARQMSVSHRQAVLANS